MQRGHKMSSYSTDAAWPHDEQLLHGCSVGIEVAWQLCSGCGVVHDEYRLGSTDVQRTHDVVKQLSARELALKLTGRVCPHLELFHDPGSQSNW